MSTIIHGSVIDSVIAPWAGRSDQASEPRYKLARSDEPSMRNLIRAELLPRVQRWDSATHGRLRIALALAIHNGDLDRMLESHYAPVSFPDFGERLFWLWVWDELFHEDLPDPKELEDYSLDWTPGLRPEITAAEVTPVPDWHSIFEARKQVRFRWTK